MKRVLHHVRGRAPGPTLVGIGGLHGNETAGVRALDRVGATLERSGIAEGEFIALAGNLPALAAGVRYLDRDLNRIWGPSEAGGGRESKERAELREVLGAIVAEARGPVHLLDLHTTSGEAPPFTVADDENQALALALSVPMVLGLGKAVAGTLVHAFAGAGVAGIAFEAGRHDDPRSEDRSADAIWLLLAALRMLRFASARVRVARRRLARCARGHPRALRLVHRHALASPARFRMRPGLRSFQEVRRGELLALEGDLEVRAPMAGRLLLPLYQPSGEDGFFLARPLGVPLDEGGAPGRREPAPLRNAEGPGGVSESPPPLRDGPSPPGSTVA